MKLSELKTGECGIIEKVAGHGGFRKRIIEMGFIKGKIVEVLLNAPLEDPVKYKIMGYEVSLRHSEADQITVRKTDNLDDNNNHDGEFRKTSYTTFNNQSNADSSPVINVALVGNPNCGKTSLFNFISGAHERVGNYSGVTVDAKEGYADIDGYHFNVVDLPGTYSLSAYSPEELYVRRQIIDKTPDVIINVIDTSNLERNLYLTTQLIDMNIRMVCALNMFDETEKRGDNIDFDKIGELFGVPMVPTTFTTGRGVEQLFKTVISIFEAANGILPKEQTKLPYRHIHILHDHEVENGIKDIQKFLKTDNAVTLRYSTRYLAIKLLENDHEAERYVAQLPQGKSVMEARDKAAKRILEEMKEDSETAIMDAKYGFIHGALQEAGYVMGHENDTYKMTHFLDRIITHKWLGFPIFIFLIWLMFETTFSLGQYPMDWIEAGVGWLGEIISQGMPEGPIKAMLVDGVIGGVGSVIVFLPQILILYGFISFMEDSGYMARAAFIMDKLMHKMGLHGKSFIPLIMGFGCNVPAVMATRTIESRRSRLITMLVLPLMSCSARLPIYIMIIGTFFATQWRSTIMISLYVIGIVMAVLMSRLFSQFVIKGEDTPFVMELPPYRFPTLKAIFRHTWEKGKQYLKKMGGIILVASIIVWALGYFPHNDSLNKQQQQEQSYIGRIGKTIEPVFQPQGFDWKLDVGIISGVGAKEIVASTMGVLYSDDDSFADDDSYSENTDKYSHLRQQMLRDGITPLTAYCFLLFVLLYFPCIATIAAIKGETGSWRWALFTAIYTTLLAWCVSAAVYQIGSLF
jgi:ferrous iron transport protein B